MSSSNPRKQSVSSGLEQLDRLLDGLYIGDNVIWYDQAGSLANVFCKSFLQSSQVLEKPLVYVTFDRSPRNLLDQLGSLVENRHLTIIDCFTWGKGAGTDVFTSFYRDSQSELTCSLVKVNEPRDMDKVGESLYAVHSGLEGDVRFIFESLTGMQELWGGEESVIRFYSHSCPRLYELNTVAYWLIEKEAHSSRLRAQINQIAQVVLELSIKRGKTSLTVVKAENRDLKIFRKPHNYWVKDMDVTFEDDNGPAARLELGKRLKESRARRGVSQTELAKMVGVTPSTISQIESSLIYPSLPALLKIAEVLSVEVSSFFQDSPQTSGKLVFSASEAGAVKTVNSGEGIVEIRSLIDDNGLNRVSPFLVEIAPSKKPCSHFFMHKGEEIGHVLSGKLTVRVNEKTYNLRAGDTIRLEKETADEWKNAGNTVARILWITVR